MFKKLKEKKELETKCGLNSDKSDEISDNSSEKSENSNKFVENISENFNNNSFDDNSDDSLIADRRVRISSEDRSSLNDNQFTDNSGESRLKTTNDFDLLNKQLLKLQNELIVSKTRNQSLEKLSIENQLLNQQLMAKSEESRQLRTQLIEYQSIGGEKDELLLRNAELSSKCQQLTQELEAERQERQELAKKLETIEKQTEIQTNNDKMLAKLNETVVKLEQSVCDKQKTIKLQQQRLHDMKKTFLQNQSNTKGLISIEDTGAGSSGDERSPRHQPMARNSALITDNSDLSSDVLTGRELNFQYLRNVVFKYMISSDYEMAIHLVRAISVLLAFSKEEEQLVKETIEWKMSWIAPLVHNKPSLASNKK